MTFFVSSGNSTNPPTNQQLSPFAPAFVTNSLHCKPSPALSAVVMNSGGSTGHRGVNSGPPPPPFSLTTVEDRMGAGSLPNQVYSTTQQQPVNTGMQQQKRMGTDPSKFKTTICRNWEQTGMCGFRGCTFAHGVDDLRPPMRSVVGVTGSSHSSLIISGHVTRSPGGNSNTSAAHNGGAQSCTKLDQLIEQFVGEVSKQKDLMLVHQEAFRTLKAMMRREQSLGQEVTSKVSNTMRKIDNLMRKLRDKDKVLVEMSRKEDIPHDLKVRARELQGSTDETLQYLRNKISESEKKHMAVNVVVTVAPNEVRDAVEKEKGNHALLLDTDDSMEHTAESDKQADKMKSVTRSYVSAVAGGGNRPRAAGGGLVPIGGDENDGQAGNTNPNPEGSSQATQNATV